MSWAITRNLTPVAHFGQRLYAFGGNNNMKLVVSGRYSISSYNRVEPQYVYRTLWQPCVRRFVSFWVVSILRTIVGAFLKNFLFDWYNKISATAAILVPMADNTLLYFTLCSFWATKNNHYWIVSCATEIVSNEGPDIRQSNDGGFIEGSVVSGSSWIVVGFLRIEREELGPG